MGEISKIQIGDTQYELVDEKARNMASGGGVCLYRHNITINALQNNEDVSFNDAIVNLTIISTRETTYDLYELKQYLIAQGYFRSVGTFPGKSQEIKTYPASCVFSNVFFDEKSQSVKGFMFAGQGLFVYQGDDNINDIFVYGCKFVEGTGTSRYEYACIQLVGVSDFVTTL